MSKSAEDTEDSQFIDVLEQGVRQVLGNRKASPSDKMAAVAAGTKLLMIRHKISESEEKGFFS